MAQGYHISSIAGCSMGALIGGVFAAGKLEEFRAWMKTIDRKKMLELTDFSFSLNHIVKGTRIIEAIMEFVPDVPIEHLPIPYCAVATDLKSGREVVFREGSLFHAIRASISLPSFYEPVYRDGMILIDGGVTNPIPLNRVARHEGDLLVGVDVSGHDYQGQWEMQQELTEKRKRSKSLSQQILNKLIPDNLEFNYYTMLSRVSSLMIRQNSLLMAQLTKPDVLVDIHLAHLKGATIGLLQAHDESEQGGLTRAVGANDTDDAIGREHEIQVVKQEFVAIGLRHVLCLYNLIAQSRSVGDENLKLLLLLLDGLVKQAVIAVETRLTFGLARLGSHAHPLQLTLQGLLTLALGLLFHSQALCLLLKPTTIVALPRNSLAAVQFQYPARDMVEEVTVVSHGNDRALILLQVLLEPVDRLGIKVVSRLIEQEHIGLLQQQATQCHTATLATAQVLGRRISWRTAQSIHGTVQTAVQVPRVGGVDDVLQFGLSREQLVHLVLVLVVFGQAKLLVDSLILVECVHNGLHTLHDYLLDGLGGVELRVLWQVAYRVARRKHHLSLILSLDACDDFHQG